MTLHVLCELIVHAANVEEDCAGAAAINDTVAAMMHTKKLCANQAVCTSFRITSV